MPERLRTFARASLSSGAPARRHTLLPQGPNLHETDGRNSDKCAGETNGSNLPERLRFSFFFFLVITVIPFQEVISISRGGLRRREPVSAELDRSGAATLYVSLSFSRRLSLQRAA